MLLITVFLGLVSGIFVYLYLSEIKKNRIQAEALVESRVRLEELQRRSDDRDLVLKKTEEQLSQAFKAVSSEVFQSNNKHFLELAKSQFEQFQSAIQQDVAKRQEAIGDIVKPVRDSLEKVDSKITDLEKSRTRTEEAFTQQIRSLLDAQKDLRSETAHLVTALRAPQSRGMWGEMQLKRVVEMAGMLAHCDFVTQESATTEAGRLRPDLIVKLPGGKNIVVDAKTPLISFLESMQQSNPDLKRQKLEDHARTVRRHLEQLSKKSYWDQFQPAPEFVVLFLPGESFFSAALEVDPTLIEAGVAQNVILATPTTLISLLRAVAFGWRQEKLAANARAIGALGKELYKRLVDFHSHVHRVGRSLDSAVESYNSVVGSLESRVLVSARRFKDLDPAQMPEMPEMNPIDKRTRTPKELGSSSEAGLPLVES